MRISPRIVGNFKIEYDLAFEGSWKRYFNLHGFAQSSGNIFELFGSNSKQTDTYPVEMDDLPHSVSLIPILTNILPVAFLTDADVIIDEIDSEFLCSVDDVRAAFARLYPELDFGGRLLAGSVISNFIDKPSNPNLVLYSGGVDANFSLFANIATKPNLLFVHGTDLYFSRQDCEAVEQIARSYEQQATDLGCNFYLVQSTFKAFLQQHRLNELLKESGVRDNYWHAIQHGYALLGIAAPLAFKLGSKRIFISSSNSYRELSELRAASNPATDESVRFFGTRITHFDYSVTRQEKISFLVNYCKTLQQQIPIRVCWQVRSPTNCCLCEKCLRTIFALCAEGVLDLDKFGFDLEKNYQGIQELIKNDLQGINLDVSWGSIISKLRLQRQRHPLAIELLSTEKINKAFPQDHSNNSI